MVPLHGQVCKDREQLTLAPQTSRGSGRLGDPIPVEARYSAPVQTGPGGPLSPLYQASGLVTGGKVSWVWD